MESHLIEELDNKAISISFDERGSVLDFGCFSLEGLHVVAMQPGAVRGNHIHDEDEIICVVSGNGICEIIAEDEVSGKRERISVSKDMVSYKIMAGAKHIVRNTGEDTFYLVCFMVSQDS